jgi:Ca2+-transporting ATPase
MDRKPYGKYEGLITSHMWIALLGQATFQLAVLFTIYLAGVKIGLSKPFYFDGQMIFTATQTNNTLVFNTFVWCQIWNQWNCRKIFQGEWNILKGITSSWLFLAIGVLSVIIQVAFIELGRVSVINRILQTTGLDYIQWPVALVVSFLCIPYHFIVIRPIQLCVPAFPIRQPDYAPDESEVEDDEKK